MLGCVASRPVIGWLLPHSNSTQITDGCGVGHRDIWQLLYIHYTHDDRLNLSSASSRHGAKRRGSSWRDIHTNAALQSRPTVCARSIGTWQVSRIYKAEYRKLSRMIQLISRRPTRLGRTGSEFRHYDYSRVLVLRHYSTTDSRFCFCLTTFSHSDKLPCRHYDEQNYESLTSFAAT